MGYLDSQTYDDIITFIVSYSYTFIGVISFIIS